MNNITLCKQSYGNGYALGITGTPDAINQFSNLLFNFEISNSEPNFLSDKFAYVLIFDHERFVRFMLERELFPLVVAMRHDNFLPVNVGTVAQAFAVGNLNAELS